MKFKYKFNPKDICECGHTREQHWHLINSNIFNGCTVCCFKKGGQTIMASLKDTALAYSSKHEITELDKVATDLPIYESSFKNKQDQEIKYFYAEMNGVKYSIKAAAMVKIKELITLRPQTKFIKVNKNSDGQYSVIPLD